MGMKLTRVDIKSYRSIRDVTVELGDGANAFVGVNNVGKSNLMRAIALAFGEDIDGFDIQRDAPAFTLWGRPTITLWFQVGKPEGPEKRFLKLARKTEEQVRPGKPHYVDSNVAVLRVKYSKTGREEYLVTKGAGDRHLPQAEQEQALKQLRACIRFILVPSGEDLDGFLQGRFTEVLHGVLADADAVALEDARALRQGYRDGLVTTLLQPLADRVLEEIGEIAPEITGIELVATVPDVEETIRTAEIRLEDAAATSLALKGTGVRGGLLVAMLRYLAEASVRSLVFAVEEPESFLHPTAQQAIREDLEGLAERDDVTLLITTHSPFVVGTEDPAAVFMLRKSDQGETSCGPSDDGQLMAAVVRELFDHRFAAKTLAEVLTLSVPDAAEAIVVVEGWTDMVFLEEAARAHGMQEQWSRLHVDHAGGAIEAALRVLVWKGRCDLPVIPLLDADEMGREAASLLRKQQIPKKQILTYRLGRDNDDAEAEHLFSDDFMAKFVKKAGENAVKTKTQMRDGWAYDIHPDFKEEFGKFVTAKADADDMLRFEAILKAVCTAARLS